MFVQFIDGPVDDASAWRRQLERWQDQCADGAVGWLGTTAGVSDDGQGFVAARFESAEAARANSERPVQSAWWSETASCLRGPASFEDCDEVATLRGGGSDTAGFVQVIRGQINDVDAGRELFLEEMAADIRPDVLGGILGWGQDGCYTMVVYFSSEQDARAGEQEPTEDDFQDRMTALHDRPPRFLDLSQPWMWSAAS